MRFSFNFAFCCPHLYASWTHLIIILWRLLTRETHPNTGRFKGKCQYYGNWQYWSLWENKVHMNVCLILTVTEIELFESPDLTPLDICLLGWNEVYKSKVDTLGILLSRVLNAAAQIRKFENQRWWTTRDFAHELQSTLMLMVWFSNMSCELWQICPLNMKFKLELRLKLTLISFSLLSNKMFFYL